MPSLRWLLKRFLSPLLRLVCRLYMAPATPPELPQDPRRPWEPPFDPAQPSRPISYPVTTLDDLESRSYFDSFHFPFNRASVPLPPHSVGQPPRRRILVCHDLKGGYLDDVWVQGGNNPEAYAIWHWHLMDVFVYFSHYLVSLPPPCWTNAAHTHGVKVLGTFLVEWEEGQRICTTLLQTKESAQMFAERLTELATELAFDGWLINFEVNLHPSQIDNLKEFAHHLSETMHDSVPGSLVIWYDAVTTEGYLDWQNQLNEKNKPFFDLCDGIFVNYTWKEKYPEMSTKVAGERRFDVYMGIDIFGRNTYGGGEWNTTVALDLLKKDDVSAALFAPGWVYETEQKPDFQTAQNRWWGLIEQSWGLLQNYPRFLPFHSDFDQGRGYHFTIEGSQVSNDAWNNISSQGFQPFNGGSNGSNPSSLQALINFTDASYSGGSNITIKGNLMHGVFFSTKLFNGKLFLDVDPVCISFSVRSDENSLLGLYLELSSESTEKTSILLADDYPAFDRVGLKYGKIINLKLSARPVNSLANASWILYESSFSMKGYQLDSIYVICVLKNPAPIIASGFSPYHASLGHISIWSTEQMKLPLANSWITEGQHISWSSDSCGNKVVSLKITWKLQEGFSAYIRRYNIYSEAMYADTTSSNTTCKFLGIARVEAFFVSDAIVPAEAIGLRFIIQVHGLDGICQELEKSPNLQLAIEVQ